MRSRSIPVVWREALAESRLDRTAKLVGLVISLHMNANGSGFPGRQRIASWCSLSDRAVDGAVRRLEAAGFLWVERSKGRKSNRYHALLPPTANEVRRLEWATAKLATLNREARAPNGEGHSPEVVELGSTSPTDGVSSERTPPLVPLDDCIDCGETRPLVHEGVRCERCGSLDDGVSGS